MGVNWILPGLYVTECQACVNMVMNLRVSYKAGNFLISLETINFSRSTSFHRIRNLMTGLWMIQEMHTKF
jgi:hypothetical protein